MLHIIDSGSYTIPPNAVTNKNAIVTIAVGDYLKVWDEVCRAGWELYGEKFGIDIIVIAYTIDNSEEAASRSPAWQKLLILDQYWSNYYHQIIWVDADIMIMPHAPNILSSHKDHRKISLVGGSLLHMEDRQLSSAQYHFYFELDHYHSTSPEYIPETRRQRIEAFTESEGADLSGGAYNTGVMVLSPNHHRDLFKSVYRRKQISRNYEQSFLSYEINELDIANIISPRFNWVLAESAAMTCPEVLVSALTPSIFNIILDIIKTETRKCYFLHFAGSFPILRMIRADLNRDYDTGLPYYDIRMERPPGNYTFLEFLNGALMGRYCRTTISDISVICFMLGQRDLGCSVIHKFYFGLSRRLIPPHIVTQDEYMALLLRALAACCTDEYQEKEIRDAAHTASKDHAAIIHAVMLKKSRRAINDEGNADVRNIMNMFRDIGRLDIAIAVSNMLQEITGKMFRGDITTKAIDLAMADATDQITFAFLLNIFEGAERPDIRNRLKTIGRDRFGLT